MGFNSGFKGLSNADFRRAFKQSQTCTAHHL